MRINWETYWLNIAEAVAARADCTRRQVGAVIVDAHNRIVSTGYNGSPPGGPSCLAGECPRGIHYPVSSGSMDGGEHCGRCKLDWPCPSAVAPGSSYDTGVGSCIAVHAEANAIIYGDPSRMRGGTVYVTDKPCDGCQRLIDGMGLGVVWDER